MREALFVGIIWLIILVILWIVLSTAFSVMAVTRPKMVIVAVLSWLSLPLTYVIQFAAPQAKIVAQHKAVQEQHFASRCADAVVQLPKAPKSAEGILVRDHRAAAYSHLSRKDNYQDFVGPYKGRYIQVEMQNDRNSGISATIWDPPRNSPGSYRTRSEQRETATLPYVLHTRALTTKEDERNRVQGIESTITDTATEEIIARRVVFAKFARDANGLDKIDAMCPEGELQKADCDANGCSVMNFLTAAVKPKLPANLDNVFHLYRGGGQRKIYCSGEFMVGPSIKPEDILWWIAQENYSNYLHFRLKNSDDLSYCEIGTLTGLLIQMRFVENGKSYSPELVRKALDVRRPEKLHTLSHTLREHF